jgi:hypothetical protein
MLLAIAKCSVVLQKGAEDKEERAKLEVAHLSRESAQPGNLRHRSACFVASNFHSPRPVESYYLDRTIA